jgi:lipid-A-disaccharide synthase
MVKQKVIMIVAGELSGDLYGALLAHALRELSPDIRLIGSGGRQMQQAGVQILAESAGFSSVGLVESLKNLHIHAKIYRMLLSGLNALKPDCVVLIDSPEFNLRFAERIKEQGIPIFYYVSPQVWAWGGRRVRKIAHLVKKIFVILEFEKRIYEDAGVDVEFVGHPLLEVLSDPKPQRLVREELGITKDRLVIGLLPGSRDHEFKKLYKIMLGAARILSKHIKDVKFLLGLAPGIKGDLEEPLLRELDIDILKERTYDLMVASDLLLVASGTATLEAAILGKPMVVTYKVNLLTLLAVLLFVKLKNFALVNLIAGREIVPECYQHRATPEILAEELLFILESDQFEKMKMDLALLKGRLGTPGASKRVAEGILKSL